MIPITFKEKVYRHCVQQVQAKISALQQVLADLRASAAGETKRTAGDKHETALAMLQLEQENTGRQLAEATAQLELLQQLERTGTATAATGSLITTNKGYFFISTALGRLVVDGIPVMTLSIQSPLGRQLAGCRAGAMVAVNGISYTVEKVE